jgi:Holliday junction DNA helicase RuvA
MIGKIKGKVDNIFDDHLLIDVGGICYIVFSSTKLLKSLNEGSKIELFIHSMQKDEITILYGFRDYKEKELFMLLTSIQGVGGKMGLSIISEVDGETLISAIQQENPKILQQVPGIGSKIALRIINELKTNKKFFTSYALSKSNVGSIKEDVISALTNLGFKRSHVVAVVDSYMKDNLSVDLETAIRSCITKLNK